MKNDIRAMIGTHKVIQSLVYDWVDVKEIWLPQGYGMVFLTDALLDDIAELTEPSDRLYEPKLIAFSERSDFTAETAMFLRQYSFRTALAYVGMDYSGGICMQRGDENGCVSIAPMEGEGTINLLLKALGVRRIPGRDEFDSLSLGIYWRMDKWMK